MINGRVSWLLHIIHARVDKSDHGSRVWVRIFGFLVYDSSKDKTKSRSKKSDTIKLDIEKPDSTILNSEKSDSIKSDTEKSDTIKDTEVVDNVMPNPEKLDSEQSETDRIAKPTAKITLKSKIKG